MRTLKSELLKWKKSNGLKPFPTSDRNSNNIEKKHTENLTDYEWKDMMGQFKQTLRRHRGALRR